MTTIDEFIALLRDELGLEVTADDAGRRLDELPGWDSVHLLWMVAHMEEATDRQVPLPALLEAPNIEELFALYAA
ncbi:acyl carrier protein [Dactylosporangium sp. NPDC005572]|uniref:acyl carrier protein n=1 Tax=Dactylosporangium sp. NPDC005572 TaxID=3156889 RepID=UPI0033B7A603